MLPSAAILSQGPETLLFSFVGNTFAQPRLCPLPLSLQCQSQSPSCLGCRREFSEEEKKQIGAAYSALVLKFDPIDEEEQLEGSPQEFVSLVISQFDGSTFEIAAAPEKKVRDLKIDLARHVKVEADHIRLMYGHVEMKVKGFFFSFLDCFMKLTPEFRIREEMPQQSAGTLYEERVASYRSSF